MKYVVVQCDRPFCSPGVLFLWPHRYALRKNFFCGFADVADCVYHIRKSTSDCGLHAEVTVGCMRK
jgi:hypothetical protein